ncbi:MAG: hypothetical protein ACP5K6_03425 [Dictyoglomus sp.]|uniref:hypothetical protein n=1 Tax=Dictyoglomus sp. TaxID=28205 RepID=UPI000182881C|nr:hypothetical protein [Dictyoglomus sp.]
MRRAVGYFRYNTEKELKFLNELYQYYRLFVNFFLPVVKLVKKERRGSKVIKSYDKPKTPYERVLECEEIEEIKEGYRESMGKVMEGSQIQGREE